MNKNKLIAQTDIFIDYSVLSNCKNLEESYGEICVKCNKCGRWNKSKPKNNRGHLPKDCPHKGVYKKDDKGGYCFNCRIKK